MFSDIEHNWVREVPYAPLSNLFRRVLGGHQWNQNEFDMVLFLAVDDQIPFLYYAAGLFLARHGHAEIAEGYLQIAASSSYTDNFATILAAHDLRSRQKPVQSLRVNLWPDDIAPLAELLLRANREQSQNNPDGSLATLGEVLSKRADFMPALIVRARAYEAQQEFAKAIADYESVLKIDPDLYIAHNNLGWIYASCLQEKVRSRTKALKHARLAAAQSMFETRYTNALLAAAEAENGHFEKAIELQQKALRLPGTDQDQADRLRLYQSGQPYRRRPKVIDPNAIRFN